MVLQAHCLDDTGVCFLVAFEHVFMNSGCNTIDILPDMPIPGNSSD
jgi:hypothetical protein